MEDQPGSKKQQEDDDVANIDKELGDDDDDESELEDFTYEPPLWKKIWRWLRADQASEMEELDVSSGVHDPRHDMMINLLEGEIYDDINLTEQQGGAALDEFYSELFEVALDSGSGEHVASKKDAPGYSVVPSAGSRAGQNFIAANNAKIPNQGQFTLSLRGEGKDGKKGRDIKSTFQTAAVTRPLWSVGRICDEGFDVKFSKDIAVVLTKQGKEVCRFHRSGGLYLARLSLKNPLFRDFRRPAAQA